jgi:hypothetical protein
MPPGMDASPTQAPPTKPPPAPPAPSRPSAATASDAAANSHESATPGANLGHPDRALAAVTRQAPAQTPRQPASGTVVTVPAPALVHGGTDYVDKLTALVTRADWAKLPAKVQSAVLAYLNDHHEMLPLFVAIRDAEESSKNEAGFATWLQGQREDLKGFYAKFYQPVLGAPLIDLHPLTPEQRIDGWLEKHRTADEICHALNGKEIELGTLPPRQQQYLIDRAFDYMGVSGFRGLAESVRGDARVRGVVAEAR